MSISTTIKSIQDIMRKDVGVDGDAQRIGQLVWMLFLKIFDDRETEWELLGDAYRSPIPRGMRWRDWASNAEGITGDELQDFVNNQLFPTLKNLTPARDDQRGFVIRAVFEDAYNYMKSGQLMRQVINKINAGIDFNKAQDRHLFGDLYEQILKDLQSAGNAGEYYTPRAVTQFMVDMVDPQLGDKVLDPACGTGGFLACTLEHIRKQDMKTVEDEQRLQASINGVEKKPLPHLLCTTNMLLHGIDVPTQIRHDNTLSRPLRDYGPKDRVDVIVTNPPFGGMEEDGIEQNFPATFRTRETADLFLVLIAHLLKDGGRAAVVLPDGTLFGEGIKTRIKEHLLQTCNLHTIVRLPNGVFSPYTGIKTNLLFFQKGSPTQEIWYYEHPLSSGHQELQQDPAHAHRGVRAGEGLVGGGGKSGPSGKRTRLARTHSRHQGAQLQPRQQEPARRRQRKSRPLAAAGRLRPPASRDRLDTECPENDPKSGASSRYWRLTMANTATNTGENMQAVEFTSKAHDNVVDLPPNLREWNNRQVRVILLADEEVARPAINSTFKAISLKTRDFRFDRDEANAR